MKYLLPIALLVACVAPKEGPDTPQARAADGMRRGAEYVENTPVPDPTNPLDLILWGVGAVGALAGTGVATAKKVNRDRDRKRCLRGESVEVPK